MKIKPRCKSKGMSLTLWSIIIDLNDPNIVVNLLEPLIDSNCPNNPVIINTLPTTNTLLMNQLKRGCRHQKRGLLVFTKNVQRRFIHVGLVFETIQKKNKQIIAYRLEIWTLILNFQCCIHDLRMANWIVHLLVYAQFTFPCNDWYECRISTSG